MKYVLLILLSVLLFDAVGQDAVFGPGYVVTNKGDTLRGSIRNDFVEQTPFNVAFQTSDYKRIDFAAGEIRSFYLASRQQLYISSDVYIDQKPTDTDNLELDDSDPKPVYRKIFMLVVVRGTASLYYHRDFRRHFFLELRDSISELNQVTYRTLYKSEIKTVDLYKDELRKRLSDCPKLNYEVGFSLESLASLVSQYNLCKVPTGSTFQYQSAADSVRIIPTVMAGVGLSFLKYKGADEGILTNTLAGAKFTPAFGQMIGVGIESNPRRSKGGASWAANLFYQRTFFESSVRLQYYNANVNIGYNYLRTNLMLRLSSPGVKQKQVFGLLGLGGGLSFGEKNYMYQYHIVYQSSFYYEGKVKDFKSVDYGAVIGAGLKLKRICLELRMESFIKYHNDTTPPVATASLVTNTLGLFVSYTLLDLSY